MNSLNPPHHFLAKRPILVEDIHQNEWDGGCRHQKVRYGEVSNEDVSCGEEDLLIESDYLISCKILTLLVQKAARREKFVRVPIMMIRL